MRHGLAAEVTDSKRQESFHWLSKRAAVALLMSRFLWWLVELKLLSGMVRLTSFDTQTSLFFYIHDNTTWDDV